MTKTARVYKIEMHNRGHGAVSERAVSPQLLMAYLATWSRDGWCHTREKLLRTALDAVKHVESRHVRAKEVSLTQVEAEMDGGYGICAGATPNLVTLALRHKPEQAVSREDRHPEQRSKSPDDGRFPLEVRHADQVSITSDPGAIKQTVHERSRQAWELHREGEVSSQSGCLAARR